MKKLLFYCLAIITIFGIVGCEKQETQVKTVNEVTSFEKMSQDIKNISINEFDLSDQEIEILVQSMIDPSSSNDIDLIIQVHQLSNNDVTKFYSLLRQENVKLHEGKITPNLKEEMEMMDKISENVNKIAFEKYQTTFHNLDLDVQDQLLNAEFSKFNNIDSQGKAFCPNEDFNNWLGGMSTWNSHSTDDSRSVQNSWADIPCDTELQYNRIGQSVTGSTASANNLILAFGGGLSGRYASGITYVIVGSGRAMYHGYFTASSLRSAIRIV